MHALQPWRVGKDNTAEDVMIASIWCIELIPRKLALS